LPKVVQGVKFQNGIEVIVLPAHHAAWSTSSPNYPHSSNYHHSRQHTGSHVLQWPSEGKDRKRNQRLQCGRVVCWPKIAVHFALHRLVVIHFYGER